MQIQEDKEAVLHLLELLLLQPLQDALAMVKKIEKKEERKKEERRKKKKTIKKKKKKGGVLSNVLGENRN